MRALRFHRFGGPEVLQLEDVPEPLPAVGHAKVRVHWVALNPLDWKVRAGHLAALPFAARPPRGLGADFAGEIAAVGGGATDHFVGQRVFGSVLPFQRDGALADYVVVPFDRLLALPDEVDARDAATLPIAGGTALQGLTDAARVRAGQRVVITGAAGGVGHFAVQVAKHRGAHVVGVCSAANAEFVRGLGADEVLDYAREDFAAGGRAFDVIFDAASATTFGKVRGSLVPDGVYLNTAGDQRAALDTLRAAVLSRLTSRQRAIPVIVRNRRPMWERLLQLLRAGVLHPHVARTIDMESVALAQRDMETVHGRGKVVVKVAREA